MEENNDYICKQINTTNMNTKLTIKNFRVFDEDGVTVDLKPITVLTGCNSSGKSSVVKAALMLNDVWKQVKDIVKDGRVAAHIDFTTYPNNLLGRFDKVLHQSKNGKITFEYTVYSYLISKDLTVTLDFVAVKSSRMNGAHLEKFEVKSEDGVLFWMEKNESEEARKAEFEAEGQRHTVATIGGVDEYEKTPKSFAYSRRVNANLVRDQFIEYCLFKNLD